MNPSFRLLALAATVLLGACGPTGDTAATAHASVPDVTPTGNVITVRMVTDHRGNYFEPAEIRARQGDVLRFELASGIHNASFPARQNPGAVGLPPATPMLQMAGQSADVLVTMDPGTHTFQCDPHLMLGMVGTVTVE